MKSFLLLTISILTMSMACNRATTNDGNNPKSNDCQDVICTEMFAMVTVKVLNKDGVPTTLDKVETIRKSTGEKITPESNMGAGVYVVLDDGYVKSLYNQSDEFIFKGYIKDKTVVEETYTISADCCHIKKVSGAPEIVVE